MRSKLLPLGQIPLWVCFGLAVSGWSFFDPFHKNVEEGNEKARNGETEEALSRYEEARKVHPGSPIPDYNRGIALSQGGELEAANDAFLSAAATSDPDLAADALYNLGNHLVQNEQYAPAVDAYLKSLDLDPTDEQARRNLEIAFQKLEEQQQQQQQQDQNEDSEENDEQQDQENQDNSDDSEDEQQQDQQPQDQQDPGQENQESQGQEPQPENEESPQGEAPPQEGRLSREDAERLLNAIESEELKVLEQLQESDEEASGGVTRDW